MSKGQIRAQEKNSIAKQFRFIEQLLRFRTAKTIPLASAKPTLSSNRFILKLKTLNST